MLGLQKVIILDFLQKFCMPLKAGKEKNKFASGAATLRWILQQLHSKTVLAHIGAFPNK
jgi:hypothetical protein